MYFQLSCYDDITTTLKTMTDNLKATAETLRRGKRKKEEHLKELQLDILGHSDLLKNVEGMEEYCRGQMNFMDKKKSEVVTEFNNVSGKPRFETAIY